MTRVVSYSAVAALAILAPITLASAADPASGPRTDLLGARSSGDAIIGSSEAGAPGSALTDRQAPAPGLISTNDTARVRKDVAPAVVPLPAAVWIGAAGLAGVAVMRRRMKRS